MEKSPKIHKEARILEGSFIIGDVEICELSNIWFGTVIRADTNKIYIGKGSNIQDNCTIHVEEKKHGVHIGDYVTVGHGSIIHGCTIGDFSLIGMGTIILNGAIIGKNTLIGAGSLITENKVIPEGVLCMGSPAKVIRELTEEEKENIKKSAIHYIELSKKYI